MASKYQPLGDFLAARETNPWRATFTEIEAILGGELPLSARTYSAWWSNNDRSHSQAKAWIETGWETANLDLDGETVEFHRVGSATRRVPHSASRPNAPTSRPLRGDPQPIPATPTSGDTLSLGGRPFRRAGAIEPVREPGGAIREDLPQSRYANTGGLGLNAHGDGPFCEFSVPGLPAAPGLYAVTVGGAVVYVGISVDLRQRWSPMGYGRISPRNCFEGGQSTNCKVNHAILLQARAGRAIELWIHETAEPRPLEVRLIRDLDPPWNAQA